MVVTLPVLLGLAVLLLFSASISAAEAAILSINKVRLRHLMEQGHRSARLTFELLTHLDRVVGTILIANNIANIVISAIASWIFIALFGFEEGLPLAMVVLTVVLLLVGEITPKLFATTHAETVMFIMVRPLRALMVVLHPLATFFTWAARGLLRLFRVPTKRRSALVTEEEIKVMIQMGREAGVLMERELRMLHGIFEFTTSTVREAMMPREQIAGIDLSAKPNEVLDVLIEQGHSRIPVYRGSLDDIAGVIYARDLLAMVRHQSLFVLADLIRPVDIVKEDVRLSELLSRFQHNKTQIAIVQDGQGRTVGLVTLEDLLEEIVGEIEEAPSS